MSELKTELVKLLRFPIIGATVVIVIFALGIDVGNIKKLGIDGVEFFALNKITSTQKQIITLANNVEVQLPKTSNAIAEKIKTSTYANTPSVTGWVYLGTYLNGLWNDRVLEISDLLLPEIDNSYVVISRSISVRRGKPRLPFYGLKARIGFANKGDILKIIELDSELGRNRVWAKVDVLRLDKK